MAEQSPLHSPTKAGTPLNPLSPERVNRHNAEKPLPASPSLPDFRGLKSTHHRTGSDIHVQAMVSRFNNLDIKDHKEMLRIDGMEVKRAHFARECAERQLEETKKHLEETDAHLRKYREEARRLRKDVEEYRDRERKVAKRIDILLVCDGSWIWRFVEM
jgi:hypothetical protein